MNKTRERLLSDLTFDKFRALAKTRGLSRYEKIGFYDVLRKDFEAHIFDDIRSKLPALNARRKTIVDIGCGCSDVPRLLIDQCERQGHELVLVDSREMLRLLPNRKFVTKIATRFPGDFEKHFQPLVGQADAVIVYSVFHYVVAEGGTLDFADKALSLLSHGGRLLIGDIPNASKRHRFFASPAGKAFHKARNKTRRDPVVRFNALANGEIDDSTVAGLMQRARLAGFDAYVVPQDDRLPMANRREDILIARP